MEPDDWLKLLIVGSIVAIALVIIAGMIIRALFHDTFDSQVMLQIWNPMVALLGGLVGYVAGHKRRDDE